MMHRVSGSEASGDVSLAGEAAAHPLGQLVKLDYDTAMGSSYRINKRVIRQVNREMNGGRFTISVLDVVWNEEREYLPSVYSVNFWNKDGSLRSSTTIRNTWVRVHDLDLPSEHFAVSAGKDSLDYVRIVFSDHQLTAR